MSQDNPKPTTSSTVQRLPSWKAPRDLTLASLSTNIAPKKTFVPNLNVNRKKNTDSNIPSKVKKEITSVKKEVKPKLNNRRKDKSFVQTTSVFSEGIAASEKKSHGGSSFRCHEGTSKENIPKPKLDLERNKAVNKELDEKTLQNLLRDDFINDLDLDDDDDKDEEGKDGKIFDKTKPIQLPLKAETKEDGLEILKKVEDNEGFFFFQFPDSLPISFSTPDNKETVCRSMKDIPSGRLGTIQLMKSGRIRLVQGDKTFYITPSTQPAFYQDVMSCETNQETKTGIMASLGPIISRLVVTPDWDTLMDST